MTNQPAKKNANSTRRVNGKLQWRVYGLGWVSTKTMVTLVVITVILIVLILLGF